MYLTIISQRIPRPNQGVQKWALPCIPPIFVKGFLGLVISFLRPPNLVSKPLKNASQPSKRTPSHHDYTKMVRQH